MGSDGEEQMNIRPKENSSTPSLGFDGHARWDTLDFEEVWLPLSASAGGRPQGLWLQLSFVEHLPIMEGHSR